MPNTDARAGGDYGEPPAPDPIWQDLGLKTPSEFQAVMPRFVARNELPEGVRYRLEMLSRIMTASYYDHLLLDVAAEYSLVTLEVALRARYLEVVDEPEDRITLYDLIEWARGGCLLDDPVVVHRLRDLRNATLHATVSQRFGILVPELMNRVMDLCNSFYENRELRVVRLQQEGDINSLLEAVAARGAVLQLGETLVDVVLARLLYVDMNASPPEYHFLFWPLFNPLPHHNVVDEGKPVLVASAGLESCAEEFRLRLAHSEETAQLILKAVDDKSHARWLHDLASSTFPVIAVIEYRTATCRNMVRRDAIRARESAA